MNYSNQNLWLRQQPPDPFHDNHSPPFQDNSNSNNLHSSQNPHNNPPMFQANSPSFHDDSLGSPSRYGMTHMSPTFRFMSDTTGGFNGSLNGSSNPGMSPNMAINSGLAMSPNINMSAGLAMSPNSMLVASDPSSPVGSFGSNEFYLNMASPPFMSSNMNTANNNGSINSNTNHMNISNSLKTSPTAHLGSPLLNSPPTHNLNFNANQAHSQYQAHHHHIPSSPKPIGSSLSSSKPSSVPSRVRKNSSAAASSSSSSSSAVVAAAAAAAAASSSLLSNSLLSNSSLSSKPFADDSSKKQSTTTTHSFSAIDEQKKRRKETHNAVERRRREFINDRIEELASLVPESLLMDMSNNGNNNGAGASTRTGGGTNVLTKDGRPNKGTILNKSAEYIRILQNVIDHQNRHEASLQVKLQELQRQLGVEVSRFEYTSAEIMLAKILESNRGGGDGDGGEIGSEGGNGEDLVLTGPQGQLHVQQLSDIPSFMSLGNNTNTSASTSNAHTGATSSNVNNPSPEQAPNNGSNSNNHPNSNSSSSNAAFSSNSNSNNPSSNTNSPSHPSKPFENEFYVDDYQNTADQFLVS